MRRQLTWALALVLATVGLATAQETTSGSIAGLIVDAQGAAIPGATVTIGSTQGTKSLVSDSTGRFFAPFLTPGAYSVKVELAGFSTVEQKGVNVRLGQRLELPFTLKVGGVQEVIEVVGSAPVIDRSSTTTGGVLSSDQLSMLPVGRNFVDALYLVAGVSSGGGTGVSNPSVSGASGLENSYVVDGVNIANPGYGALGSYSIIFGSLGSGVTSDFIKETQVKSGGFEAEYGESTGGVVNVVTKSGTNALHGSIYGYMGPDALESSYKTLRTTNGTVNTAGTQSSDFGISLGGPLMKDKLFFFGAFNPQYQRRTLLAPDGFALATKYPDGVDQKRHINSYAGKLSWQASGNHRFDVTAFGDPAHGDAGPQQASAMRRPDEKGFEELKQYGGHSQALRYDGIVTPSWLLEATVAHNQNSIQDVPLANEWAYTDFTVVPTQTSGGLGTYEKGNENKSWQYSLKSTNLFHAGGSHQLRYGAAYSDISYDQVNQRTGPTFTLADGTQTATGATIQITSDPVFGKIYRVNRANLNEKRHTTQKYTNFFAQDSWEIGKHLIIRPGIRYERQELVGAPLKSGEIVSYTFTNNWAPRIGVTYDLKGDGKSKLYASWGRFYAKVPNDLAARALSADAGVTRADYFDAGLTQPIPDGVLAGKQTKHLVYAGQFPSTFDPAGVKTTSQDEFLGGLEVQAFKNVNLGVRYIHRKIGRIVEDIGTAQVVAYDLGYPGLDSVEYFLTNPHQGYPATIVFPGLAPASFEDPVHKYDAVEFTANKTFSDNWSLVASYRWSKLKGNFEGFFRNDNGQSDPGITSLFDFPTNDPTYSTIGHDQFGYRGDIRYLGCSLGCGELPNDRTNQVKIYANRTWGALNLGAGFNWGSGKPLTALAALSVGYGAGEIPESIRGAGFQTVDGMAQRAPDDIRFDLHADYTFKLGGQRRFVLLADTFNLFNRQTATDYDARTELDVGSPNPDFGQPKLVSSRSLSVTPSYQTPRQVRIGARFEW